ncbi:hypothetical protein PY257_03545 [Ramlibacter sp. H39-3-26]|uniref:DNA polymerase Y family protein n=1 Tax=Curvibacter soli TaxID=3031331 RepID=UPI0023DAA9B2|nr:hypothetical protein [Ramlibacter sp. H39-3-26]MDF1484262.1 hypothetical protein [Ramlibacter sp. H39-3-26]
MLRSLFIDFNAYFASVEQQADPRLRGRPVGVVQLMTDSTCCIAASYEARAFGVRTGTNVAEARRLCPGIVFVQSRPEVYVDYHQRALAAVERVAPVRQVRSIDEMECELTGSWRQRAKALEIARRIKQSICGELGECLRTSIGIAPNTLLAKLASDMQKPDGLVVLEQRDLPAALLHLPLAAITGIGPGMQARLARCGIATMAQFYAAPRDLLRTAWGGVAGSEMYDQMRGQWMAVRTAKQQSLGHSHVLPPAQRNPEGAY